MPHAPHKNKKKQPNTQKQEQKEKKNQLTNKTTTKAPHEVNVQGDIKRNKNTYEQIVSQSNTSKAQTYS